MSDTFRPRLVNDVFQDPVLYVGFRHQRRALLFDLGNIDRLSLHELHKVSHIFVSHAHIDHFIGFDRFLRHSLNRDGEIHLYGPRGIAANVQGKLNAYSWNLIRNYPFTIAVHEVDAEGVLTVRFRAAAAFRPEPGGQNRFNGQLLVEPWFEVTAAILDHGIPCLAFCLRENKRVNIRQERLNEAGIKSGPWLDELKRLLRENAHQAVRLTAPAQNGGNVERSLEEWRAALIVETQGQKIAYVVDTSFNPENIEKIVSLAQEADLFYCEAAFATADKDKARERYHLTTDQAATLARMARVKRLIPFHFSSRYEGEPDRLLQEALEMKTSGADPTPRE